VGVPNARARPSSAFTLAPDHIHIPGRLARRCGEHFACLIFSHCQRRPAWLAFREFSQLLSLGSYVGSSGRVKLLVLLATVDLEFASYGALALASVVQSVNRLVEAGRSHMPGLV